MSKLYEVFHSSEGILKETIIDVEKFIYIIKHYNDRLYNEDLNAILNVEELLYLSFDNTYFENLFLMRSINNEKEELGRIPEEVLFESEVNLSEFNKYLNLSEESLKKLEMYYNRIYKYDENEM